MGRSANHSDTREQLLRAALKHFANSGYAATSVQDIVDDARLSKPALYYHIKDKAGLFQALVHEAHDARYRLLQAAAASQAGIRAQLEAIFSSLLEYFRDNRDLIRISFATMFAAPGEVPEDAGCQEKCRRNFEFIHDVIKQALQRGELDPQFNSEELTFGIYGMVNFYLVGHFVCDECQTDHQTARRVVDLFLAGAAPKTVAPPFKKSTQRKK